MECASSWGGCVCKLGRRERNRKREQGAMRVLAGREMSGFGGMTVVRGGDLTFQM